MIDEIVVGRRTPTPARLPSIFPDVMKDESTNATVVEAFRLHYGECGPRDVNAGTRCRVEQLDGGLVRFHDRMTSSVGAVVDAAHFEIDVREEGYRYE